jgi:hypothetical protein
MKSQCRPLTCEVLEDRVCPDGNVIVTTDGLDNLIITGDTLDNHIQVERLGTGTVLVRGLPSVSTDPNSITRLNGSRDPVTAFINNPRGGKIRINLSSGSDRVIFRNINSAGTTQVPGDVEVTFSGSGSATNFVVLDNSTFLGNVTVRVTGNEALNLSVPSGTTAQFLKSFNISTQNGRDFLRFDGDVTVAEDFVWNAGNSDNTLTAVNLQVSKNVNIISGNGSDLFLLTAAQFNAGGGTTTIQTGGGSDTVGFFGPNATLFGQLTIDTQSASSTGADADLVALLGVRTQRRVNIDTGPDADTIIMAGGSRFDQAVSISTGAGRDRIDVRQASFVTAITVLLGADDDSAGIFSTRMPSGSVIDGGAGTDRLLRDRTTSPGIYRGFENVRVI